MVLFCLRFILINVILCMKRFSMYILFISVPELIYATCRGTDKSKKIWENLLPYFIHWCNLIVRCFWMSIDLGQLSFPMPIVFSAPILYWLLEFFSIFCWSSFVLYWSIVCMYVCTYLMLLMTRMTWSQ